MVESVFDNCRDSFQNCRYTEKMLLPRRIFYKYIRIFSMSSERSILGTVYMRTRTEQLSRWDNKQYQKTTVFSLHVCCYVYIKLKRFSRTEIISSCLFFRPQLKKIYMQDKVFKNGPSRICRRQPLKKLKVYRLLYKGGIKIGPSRILSRSGSHINSFLQNVIKRLAQQRLFPKDYPKIFFSKQLILGSYSGKKSVVKSVCSKVTFYTLWASNFTKLNYVINISLKIFLISAINHFSVISSFVLKN